MAEVDCSQKLAVIEKLVSTSGILRAGRETRRSNVVGSKVCGDILVFGGGNEEYEDWQHKGGMFLNSRCLFFFDCAHRETDLEDTQDYATQEDFLGRPADVTFG